MRLKRVNSCCSKCKLTLCNQNSRIYYAIHTFNLGTAGLFKETNQCVRINMHESWMKKRTVFTMVESQKKRSPVSVSIGF